MCASCKEICLIFNCLIILISFLINCIMITKNQSCLPWPQYPTQHRSLPEQLAQQSCLPRCSATRLIVASRSFERVPCMCPQSARCLIVCFTQTTSHNISLKGDETDRFSSDCNINTDTRRPWWKPLSLATCTSPMRSPHQSTPQPSQIHCAACRCTL
jgi:hypothetical protein